MPEPAEERFPALQVLDAMGPWRQVLPKEHYRQPSVNLNRTASKPGRDVWPEAEGYDVETWFEGEVAVAAICGAQHLLRTCSDVFAELWHGRDLAQAEADLLAAVEGQTCSEAAADLPPDVQQAIREALGKQRVNLQQEATGPMGDCPVLETLRDFLARYVVLPGERDVDVLALWVAHTYLVDAFEVTPRLLITSPQKESGKTRVLDLLDMLVFNSVQVVNVSPPSIYRSVSQAGGRRTLLIDELDTVLQSNNASAEGIRGILNGGYKRGAKVTRSGDKSSAYATQEFSIFGPVAMAGLGAYDATLSSRSINIRMKRRSSSEPVEPFRRREVEAECERLRADLEKWTDGARGVLGYPELPDALTDRAAEIWEPLLAVADVAGGSWPDVAREAAVAAVAAVAGSSGVTDPATKALREIRRIFDDSGTDRLWTKKLLKELKKTEDADVARLTDVKLSALLAPYDVHPVNIRQGETVKRGYRREDFEVSWKRYL